MLKSLGVMIGTWDVMGREAGPDAETHGGATFSWTEVGFYLVQRIDMVDPTSATKGGFDVRKVIASEFVSLDGVIEGPIWTFQVPSEEQPKFKFDELAVSDALPLGRVTYEGFVAAGPQMTEQASEYADMMNGYRKFVLSTTLEEPLDWNNSRLIRERRWVSIQAEAAAR